METIEGQVARVRYHNQANGYSVLDVQSTTSSHMTVVCYMPDIRQGDKVRAQGEWGKHEKYGNQFQAKNIEVELPCDKEGLLAFLTKLVKGIGVVKAKLIIERFGDKTIDVLDNQPELLKEIPGIGNARYKAICDSWQNSREMRKTMIYLQGHGITPGYAVKIWKTYKEKSKEVLQDNPYRVAEDVWGIGFKIADNIALKFGIPADSPKRISTAILYALSNAASVEGHCYLKAEELSSRLLEMLNIKVLDMKESITLLINNGKVKIEGSNIYQIDYWKAQQESALNIIRLSAGKPTRITMEPCSFIRTFEENNHIQFSMEQADAIHKAANNNTPFIVITGLPGTGKTSVCKALLDLYDSSNLNYCLCAPTGKAAERLMEVTGREAMTLHRALGYKREYYEFNEHNPLPFDVVVVDEASMLDLVLFWKLISAIKQGARLVLIGDIAQLPSVGAGNVLSDIIDSGHIPVVALKKIFRQAEVSPIIKNAHRINAGEPPVFENGFDFVEAEAKDVQALIKHLIPGLAANYGDVQVLSPMHKGDSGVAAINVAVQESVNPDKGQPALEQSFQTLRTGDKVVQLKNNYDKDVFNGMTGIIGDIDFEEETFIVNFDGKLVKYEFDESDELKLAYALSVHKSQGSEFRCVILCLNMSHYIMLHRKLIYTAVTRAKEKLIIIGDKRAMHIAVKNVNMAGRNTDLAYKIKHIAQLVS